MITSRIEQLINGIQQQDSIDEKGIDGLIFLQIGNLVSCSEDWTIKIWDLKTGSLVQTLTGHTSIVHALAALQKIMS